MAKNKEDMDRAEQFIKEIHMDKFDYINKDINEMKTDIALINQKQASQDNEIEGIKKSVHASKKDETESTRFEKKLKLAIISLLLTIFIAPIITRVLEKLLFP